MKLQRPPLVALFAAALIAAGAGAASATTIHLAAGHEDIDLDGEDVLITAEDGSEARVTPDGVLRVDGRKVALREQHRRALTRYNETVHSIVDRAVVIGIQGAGVAVSAIGVAIAAIASGNAEDVEERVEARAERIKDNARRLCREVRHLQRIQDALADDLAAFRPFAVIDEDDADECRVED